MPVEKRYRVRVGAGKWSRQYDLEGALDRAKLSSRMRGGPFRVQERGDDEWGPYRTPWMDMEKRLRPRLKRADIGDYFYIDNKSPRHVHIRVVGKRFNIPDTTGTSAIDETRYYLYRAFPRLESWGICNCRRVSGSDTWSQHAYCNGEDSHAGFITMQKAALWLPDAARGNVEEVPKLPVSQVFFNRTFWSPQTGKRSGYQYGHTDHIHFSGSPMRSGTPPCA
jgi:hypothetical protein